MLSATSSLRTCHLSDLRPRSHAMIFLPPPLLAPCSGASVLRSETAVDAVELFDRASLRECENNEDMVRAWVSSVCVLACVLATGELFDRASLRECENNEDMVRAGTNRTGVRQALGKKAPAGRTPSASA